MKLLFTYFIIFNTFSGIYGQTPKEKYKEKILVSKEYADMKYSQAAYLIFRKDFTLKTSSFSPEKIKRYNLVLNELNDNRNEKAKLFKAKFKKINQYFEIEEIHGFLTKPILGLTAK